ncbi:MAG: ankyrin repeat domain-containing protein [Verrucomicrobiales bacterium]
MSADILHRFGAALCADKTEEVRQFILQHPQIKHRLNDPIGPFNSCSIHHVRSPAMLELLMECGADLNIKSNWWAGGFGLLHTAPKELALYAIQRGAVVDIHAAARLGLVDHLRRLLKHDASLVHSRGGDGQTALHFAENVEVARILLEHGAEIDARDIDHESTPAQYMVRDRQEVARHLVENGCHVDIMLAVALGLKDRVEQILQKNPDAIETVVSETYFPKKNPQSGGTIYTWTLGANKSVHSVARDFGQSSMLQMLLEHTPAPLQFAIACELNESALAEQLLQKDPELFSKLPPALLKKLPQEAENNNTAVVTLMVKLGWPVDARARHHATALHWAGFHGNTAMAKALINHGSPLEDAANEFHSTPLGWAIHGSEHGWKRDTGDYPGTVEALLAAGAQPPQIPGGTEKVRAALRNGRS